VLVAFPCQPTEVSGRHARRSRRRFPGRWVSAWSTATASAGIAFRRNRIAAASCCETLGAGCAFRITTPTAAGHPSHQRLRLARADARAGSFDAALYRNNRNGTFTDVTRAAGLDVELYSMGVTVGDYDNDGFPDVFITAVGQNRLFRNTGEAHSST
jgi:hypothetical protein